MAVTGARTEIQDVIRLVLAGGSSTRFGAAKALHPVEGVPMVERVYRAVAAVIHDVRIGLPAADIPNPLRNVPPIYDSPAGIGPIGGLRAGLGEPDVSWVFLAACDMPWVSPEAVVALLEARQTHIGAVIARGNEGRIHPLLGVYHRRILRAVDDSIQSGALSMKGLAERVEATYVDLPARVLHNVNRPEDLGSDDP